MNFNNSLPEWKNTGIEPSDSLKMTDLKPDINRRQMFLIGFGVW